ncbi:MAG TPA: heavy metal-responsive transcriptional regulator [bacterium]|nr:heavy metal-responsive transcriptional regulator [bacterium]
MKSSAAFLKIGQVAKQSGASIDTIRYYEKKGILNGPARTAGGFRVYPPEAVDQLVFIRKAQTMGLTLKEIKQIICCGDEGLGPCCDLTVELFTKKIQEFERKTSELNRMKRKLKAVLGTWVGKKKKP